MYYTRTIKHVKQGYTKMINKYLDEAKERNSIKSDSALAKNLGVTRGAVNLWRQGGTIKHEHLAKLARLCGMKIEMMIATYELNQPQVPEIKSMWKRIAGEATLSMMIAFPILAMTVEQYILC